jgi:hypothetical protein
MLGSGCFIQVSEKNRPGSLENQIQGMRKEDGGGPHSSITQKTAIDIFTAVRTSDFF